MLPGFPEAQLQRSLPKMRRVNILIDEVQHSRGGKNAPHFLTETFLNYTFVTLN